MIFLWFVAGGALVVAVVALSLARRASARLERVSQMYWELKYQYSELRAQLERPAGGAAPETPTAAERPPADGFVPLTSIRR